MDVREQISALGKSNTSDDIETIGLLIKLMAKYLEQK
jgi:hypothetical protein